MHSNCQLLFRGVPHLPWDSPHPLALQHHPLHTLRSETLKSPCSMMSQLLAQKLSQQIDFLTCSHYEPAFMRPALAR